MENEAEISDALLDFVDFMVDEDDTGPAMKRLAELLHSRGVTAEEIWSCIE